jgi:hypothetical protein
MPYVTGDAEIKAELLSAQLPKSASGPGMNCTLM